MGDLRDFLRQAANVRPTQRQQRWLDMGFYGFIHFGVNTFTGREWGTGREDPRIFNPTRLDCRQWVEVAKSAGMGGLILTAKHHDGFCLWPSKYTEHSVKHSPFRGGKGDVVREFADACRQGGVKFGFYLSPWDRNSPLYGTEAYNDYYKAQLTELLTEYGDVFMVWFDGACGEGPNGKKQEYDFRGYIDLVRKYQPNACIFNDRGPDVRWIGNESGAARFAEWAVMPRELTSLAQAQTGPGPLYEEGALAHVYNTQPELGALSNILPSGGLCFCPAETDMSIRPGWFWHEEEQPHSLERLLHTYITSVGGNSGLNLNLPPNREGCIDEKDVARMAELGRAIERLFAREAPARLTQTGPAHRPVYELDFGREVSLGCLLLQEEISRGQRVESFLVYRLRPDGQWENVYQGTTIGNRRMALLKGMAQKLRLQITFARDAVNMKTIRLFEGE